MKVAGCLEKITWTVTVLKQVTLSPWAYFLINKVELILKNWGKDLRSRWWIRKMLNSHSFMNISKLQLHIEWLSLKLIGGLDEQVFYNKGHREKSTWSQVEGEEKQSVWEPGPLGGSTEEEGVITGLRSCLGSKEFKQRIKHLIPEIQTT